MPEFGETGRGFKMKGFTPFTKKTGKEYRTMRRDKYDTYQDEAKSARKDDRKEMRSLRKSQRQEHGLLGARGERRAEKDALRSRQTADKHDARAGFMSELKSDRKKFGGRRHLPWNWSARPDNPEGRGVSPMIQGDGKGVFKPGKKRVPDIPKKPIANIAPLMTELVSLTNPLGGRGKELMAKMDSINPNWRDNLENIDEID